MRTTVRIPCCTDCRSGRAPDFYARLVQDDPERSGGTAGNDRYGMPRWIPRLITIVVLVCIGLFAAFHMLRAVRTLLVLLVIAFFLSIALEPGVNFLNRKGWKRGWATGLIFLVTVLVLGVFIGLMVPLVVGQISNLIRDLPGYVDNLAKFADRFGIEFSSERLREALTGVDTDLQALAADVAGGVFGVGTALLSTVMQILTVALFTFYMTADGPRMRRVLLSMLPAARQREVLWAIEVAIDRTGGYFYSRALLAGISAAIARFSQRAVPIGQVPSGGNALTGSRSPFHWSITAVPRLTKSGAASGTVGRILMVPVAAPTGTSWRFSRVASTDAKLRLTTSAPFLP